MRRDDDEQQLSLVVVVEANPLVEMAAAQMLTLAIEECRNAGIVVHRARLEIDTLGVHQ